MSTATEAVITPPDGEARIVLEGVGWEGYEAMLALAGERRAPRMAYRRGSLELMSPGYRHESLSERMGLLVMEVAAGLDRPCQPTGTTTFRRRDLDQGIQGDKTFYLAHEGQVRDLKEIDLDRDPPPDLAIEVEITRPLVDRAGIDADLGVPEVWRCDGKALVFLQLRPDGTYAPTPTSLAFPFLTAEEVGAWVLRPRTVSESRWLREVRAWVQDELAPRVAPEGPAA